MLQFDKDMASPHAALFLRARAFLLSFEDITETRKPRITTYAGPRGGLCHLRTMPHGIDLGFLKGAKLDDAPGRLTGSGKTLRVLSLDAYAEDTIAYYVEQALVLAR